VFSENRDAEASATRSAGARRTGTSSGQPAQRTKEKMLLDFVGGARRGARAHI